MEREELENICFKMKLFIFELENMYEKDKIDILDVVTIAHKQNEISNEIFRVFIEELNKTSSLS